MLGIHDLTLFVLSGLLLNITPGADTLYIVARSMSQRDGVSLFIVSAFRSIERQAEIFRRKLLSGITLEKILAANAPPGYSEHHTGYAVDIATPGSPLLEIAFEETPAFRWLENHANSFGFYLSYPKGNSSGYQYEPWHWCFKHADTIPC